MSRKKRFDQLETPRPEEEKKPSILQKFSFKRKLEIEGVEREKLPVQQPLPKASQSTQTPEVKVTRTYQPNTPKTTQPESKPKPDMREARIELDNIAQEIEIAEQKKQAREAQQRAIQTQKKVQQDKKAQLEEARQRAESAKNKILLAIIVIPILGYIVVQAAKSVGTGERSFGSELIWLIITIALGGYGRSRWRRW